MKSLRASLGLVAALALSGLSSATGNDCLSIHYSKPLYDVMDVGTLYVSGSPNASGVILFDTVPGPLSIPGIGVLGVGLSQNFAWMPITLNSCGSADFIRATFPCDSLEVNNLIYTQAATVNLQAQSVCLSNVAILSVEDINGTCGGCSLTGCTPGYWKNHTSKWGPTGLDKNDDFDLEFGVDAFGPNKTLLEALKLDKGKYKNLAPHAVAALLNALHPSEHFPYSAAEVRQLTADAILSGDAKKQEAVKDLLEAANQLGCPF